MEFLHEILRSAGADTSRSFTVVPSFGAYFRGVKGVEECTPSSIAVRLGKQRVTLLGEGLSVGSYYCGDLFISGRVKGVELE